MSERYALEAAIEDPTASSIHYTFPEDLKSGFSKPLEIFHDDDIISDTIFNNDEVNTMFEQFFREAEEDISMEVQEKPEEGIDVTVGTNPVDIAKAEPENVTIGCEHGEDGCPKYCCDCKDIVTVADMHEATVIEAVVAIAEANRTEDHDINVNNFVVMLDESNAQYQRIFEHAGIVCEFKNCCLDEEGDITVEVQDGPDGDIEAKMDEKESDPVDDAKRTAGSTAEGIVVGCKDGNCYIDAKDLEKYADANEKSPEDSVKDIVEANEEYGMTLESTVVAVTEGASKELVASLLEAGIMCEGFISEEDAEEE